jgi:hypothetical protein
MEHALFLPLFYGLHLVLLVVVLWIVRLEYRTQNVAILFWLTVLGIYVLPSTFDPLRGQVQLEGSYRVFDFVDGSVLLRAHLFALGFSATYLLARLAVYRRERALYAGHRPTDLPALLRASPHVGRLSFVPPTWGASRSFWPASR